MNKKQWNAYVNRLVISVFLVLLVVGCQPAAYEARRIAPENGPTPIPTTAAVAAPTYTVERGDVIRQLHFPGRIAPVVEQELLFPLEGKILQIHVKRGDSVHAGDILVELEIDTDLLVGYRQAEINVELAQLALDYALLKSFTPPTIDQQYQIDRLKLLLESAQLELLDLQKKYGSDLDAATRIIAPFDGKIVSLNLVPGQQIAAGDVVGVIANLNQIEVSAELRDSQLQELSEGMAVEIEPSGKPGDVLTSRLYQLPYPYGSGGGIDVNTQDNAIRISFDDPRLALSQYAVGDLVSTTITIAEHEDVLWLPLAAIRDFNGRKFVVVQNGEVQQRMDVLLGITGEGRVEILEGVSEGQVVIGQ
jgi:RND family efflux transporter MFP subunit